MSTPFDDVDQPSTRWVPLSGPFTGIEVLVVYASPEAGEAFRRRMRKLGILRETRHGREEPADGRTLDYLVEFCKTFTQDWRGVDDTDTGEAVKFDPARVARAMNKYGPALEEITSAVGRAEDFFGRGDSA